MPASIGKALAIPAHNATGTIADVRAHEVPLGSTHGWYGLTVTTPTIPSFGVQLAGHVEDGADSITDPMIGAGKSA